VLPVTSPSASIGDLEIVEGYDRPQPADS